MYSKWEELSRIKHRKSQYPTDIRRMCYHPKNSAHPVTLPALNSVLSNSPQLPLLDPQGHPWRWAAATAHKCGGTAVGRELEAGAFFLSDKASRWGTAASLSLLVEQRQIFSFWRDVAHIVAFGCVKVLVCSSDLREKQLLLFLQVWKQGDHVSRSFLICFSFFRARGSALKSVRASFPGSSACIQKVCPFY